ncbi:MAG: transposase domain-containing protein, partial [Paracoccaceae bacterium]
MTTEVHYQSLLDVSRQIANGDLSPVELVDAMLARIEAVDGDLKSFALVTPERARADAQAAEVEIKAGRSRGPLSTAPEVDRLRRDDDRHPLPGRDHRHAPSAAAISAIRAAGVADAMTVIETAKLSGLNPEAYLTAILGRIR